jgi:hypothetical protein
MNMRHRKLPSQTVFIAVVGIMLAADARAADAVFSNDGQHIYTVNDEKMVLDDVDLNKHRVAEIRLTPPSGSTIIADLSRANDGRLLLASKTELWALDVGAAAWTKLCVAPAGVEFKRVAFDPKTGGCLLLTRNKEPRLLWLGQGMHELERVEATPHDINWYMVFDQAGQLLFSDRDDLWCGAVDRGQDFQSGKRGLFLAAYRYLATDPLGGANYLFKKPSIGEIAVDGDSVYITISGLNDRTENSGAVITLPLPHLQVPRYRGFDLEVPVQNRLSFYTELFRAARVIFDQHVVCLCAARTGGRAYFETGGDRYLVTGGKAEKLNILEP